MRPEVLPHAPSRFMRPMKILLASTFGCLGFLILNLIAHAFAPAPILLVSATLLMIALGVLSAASTTLGIFVAYRRFPAHGGPLGFMVVLTLSVLLAHAFVINSPPLSDCGVIEPESNGCIMDEGIYYVPAANLLLNGTQCGLQGGNETPSACNMEHPFLGKAFIAAGMAIFGDNNIGYRFFQAVLGTFSLPLLFLLALKLSGSRKLSYTATLLFAADVMFFTHSSAGLIDVQQVFFMLFAFVSYLYGLRFWRFDKYSVSGVFLGLAGLTKETAIFGVLAFGSYLLFFGEGGYRRRLLSVAKVGLVVAVVFGVGLQTYDTLFASATFPTFFAHIGYIFQYSSSLTSPLSCSPANAVRDLVTGSYWCKFPGDPTVATPILPQDWVTFYTPVQYYWRDVCDGGYNALGACIGGSYVGVGYYGVTNLIVTWMVFLWVPLAFLVLYRRRGDQGGPEHDASDMGPIPQKTRETQVAGLSVIWFLWSYLPYLLLQYGLDRITYPYYFLSGVPSLALGAAFLFTRLWFPRRLAYLLVVSSYVFFFVFFPDKSFLPVFLRVVIGR